MLRKRVWMALCGLVLTAWASTPGKAAEVAGPLAGKKITLDAGHGGEEFGAVGIRGLKEKDANRAVVERLQALLEGQGAVVRLTRPEDETVSLEERVQVHLEWKGDLFVSVHHNANAEMDRSVDRSEVYYHYRDRQGPSRDLAYEVVRRLSQRFALPSSEAKVIYAYYVLRENNAPAILGEASYISNASAEQRLRDPDMLQAEAEGYFDAILNFFDKGWPEITWQGPLESGRQEAEGGPFEECPLFIARIKDARQGVDPSGIWTEINGKPVDFAFDPGTGTVRFTSPEPLPSGEHFIRLVAQNNAGCYGLAVERRFWIVREPVALRFETEPAAVPHSREALVRGLLRAWDRHGFPVSHPWPVEFQVSDGEIYRSEPALEEGYALVYFYPRARVVEVTASVGGLHAGQAIETSPEARQLHGAVFDAKSRLPVPGARIEAGASLWRYADREGWFMFPADIEEAQLQVTAPGYWPQVVEIPSDDRPVREVRVQLRRMFGGALRGRSFVLDAEFGGKESGQVGQSGLRAADVNLKAAFIARRMLEAAGAKVDLTREEDITMSDVDRVRFGLARDFDWFITLRHAEPRPGENEPPELNVSRAYSKWSDAGGMARCFPHQMREMMGTDGADHKHCSTWEVMHASNKYQAIGLSPLLMTAPGAAERLERLAPLRKEAQALLFGLVEYYSFLDGQGQLPEPQEGRPGRDEQLRGSTGAIRGRVYAANTGEPLDDVLLSLEGLLWTATEADGRFFWKYLDPGRYELEFFKPGYRSEQVNLLLWPGDELPVEVNLIAE